MKPSTVFLYSLRDLLKLRRAGLASAYTNRSDRCLVENRRRIHRCAFRACRAARRRAVRSRAPASVALRARANFQVRHPAQTKTTLRRQDHPRRPFPRRLSSSGSGAIGSVWLPLLVLHDLPFAKRSLPFARIVGLSESSGCVWSPLIVYFPCRCCFSPSLTANVKIRDWLH